MSELRFPAAFYVEDERDARAECDAWLRDEPNVASFDIEKLYRDDPIGHPYRWRADIRITLRDAEQPTLWEVA